MKDTYRERERERGRGEGDRRGKVERGESK